MIGLPEACLLFNLLAFAVFAVDKKRAVDGGWRIPEWVLIVAAAAGAFGALCGMYFFNHKTSKPLFYIAVPLFLLMQIITMTVTFLAP